MKALLYLAGLIVCGVLLVWYFKGMNPEAQWNYIKVTSDEIAGHISDTKNSANKLKNTLDHHFEEASDVYHGKEFDDSALNQAQ